MALSKIQAESMNLADTFAFTGTVSGTGMNLLLNATISSAVSEYVIDSTYFNSSYDTYFLTFHMLPATDGVYLYSRAYVGGVGGHCSAFAQASPVDQGKPSS